jgi:predicted TIM-barrel fold metal-dependent hydrolase
MNRYMNPAPGLVKGLLRADAVSATGEDPGADPNFVVSDLLDRYDPESVLLIPLPMSIWLDTLNSGALAAAMNEYFINEWLTVDSRFRLAACVFPIDPLDAAREIRRRAQNERIAAIFMPLIATLMGQPHYDPIYEAASEAGLPIVVHPSGAEGTYLIAPALAGGVPSTWIERHVGLTQVAAANAASLVLSGTFDRFPNLRVVFAEYGFTWVAPLMWRMDSEAKRMRDSGLRRHPVAYLLEHLRFCTQPVEEPDRASRMTDLIRMMRGESTLMFSTDYPHWDTDDPSRVLTMLTGELRQRVFYENAKETFAGRL